MIDKRIIELVLENKDLIRGIGESIRNLDLFNRAAREMEHERQFELIGKAARRMDLSPVVESIGKISSQFDAFKIAGMSAISTVANYAVQKGAQIADSLSFKGIRDGFREYETQMNAVQTILSNTRGEGTNVEIVSKALDELNEYADKTIYNFTEMTSNIGRFTAAGVKLQDSVAAIKGISNLAAVSGASSEATSRAMYQISQGLSAGTFRLTDWMSIENAGMGGKVFQDALIETAKVHGVNVEAMIKKQGSFRRTLEKNWLTAKIFNETLQKFTGDLTRDQLKKMKYTDKQIDQIMALGKDANEAATKVKTLTQLMSTLAEAVGSGWAQTFRHIVGDFEEAKKLYTAISDKIGGFISSNAEARNKFILEWKKLGGRDKIIEALSHAFGELEKVFNAVGKAFSSVFSPVSVQYVYDLTKAISDFITNIKISDETLDKLQRTFSGVFAIFSIWRTIIGSVAKGLFTFFSQFQWFGKLDILGITARIGDFLVGIDKFLKDGDKVGTAVSGFFSRLADGLNKIRGFAYEKVAEGLRLVGLWLGVFWHYLKQTATISTDGLTSWFDRVRKRLEPMAAFFELLGLAIKSVVLTFYGAAVRLATSVAPVFRKFGEIFMAVIQNLMEWVGKAFSSLVRGDFSFSALLDILNTGILATIFAILQKFLKGDFFKSITTGGGLGKLTESFSALEGCLKSLQTNLKVKTLFAIAGAIALLAASVVVISTVDSGALTKSLTAITVMLGQMFAALILIDKFVDPTGVGKLSGIALALIMIGVALQVMSIAVIMLGSQSWETIAKGLIAATVLLSAAVAAAVIMSKNHGALIRGSAGIVAFAVAINILGIAVGRFGKMDWETLGKGLLAVTVLMGAYIAMTHLLGQNKVGIKAATGLLIVGAAMHVFAAAIEKFGAMDWRTLGVGIGVIVAISGMFLGLAYLLNSAKPRKLVTFGLSLLVIAYGAKAMAEVVKLFGDMDLASLAQGLLALGALVAGISLLSLLIPKDMVSKAVGMMVMGLALKVVVGSVVELGNMPLANLAQGLIAIASAILIFALASSFMNANLAGAAAIFVMAAAIAVLAPAMKLLGSLSIGEVSTALITIALGIALLAGLALLIAPAIPVLLALAAAMLAIGVSVIAIGAGFLLVAIGLGMIAAAGTGAAVVISSVVMALLDLIPLVAVKMVEGITAFVTGLAKHAPVILAAIAVIIVSVLRTIRKVAPEFLETVADILVKTLRVIRDTLPEVIQLGFDIIMALARGVRDNIGELVTTAIEIVTEIVNGIADGIPQILSAAGNLVVNFVQGLADSIKENTPAMIDAGIELAEAVAQGIGQGAAQVDTMAKSAASGLAAGFIQGMKDKLGIKSPSRVAAVLGAYAGEGFVLGIESKRKDAEKSAGKFGEGVIGSLGKAIEASNKLIDDPSGYNPTITPVLDLDSFRKDVSAIDDFFGSKSVDVSVEKADKARPEEKRDLDSENSPGGDSGTTFNQYNYSPKALSPTEIYRQTNRQLLAMKGVPKRA